MLWNPRAVGGERRSINGIKHRLYACLGYLLWMRAGGGVVEFLCICIGMERWTELGELGWCYMYIGFFFAADLYISCGIFLEKIFL